MIDSILISLHAAAQQLQLAYEEAKREGRLDLAAAIQVAQVKLDGCFTQLSKPRRAVA